MREEGTQRRRLQMQLPWYHILLEWLRLITHSAALQPVARFAAFPATSNEGRRTSQQTAGLRLRPRLRQAAGRLSTDRQCLAPCDRARIRANLASSQTIDYKLAAARKNVSELPVCHWKGGWKQKSSVADDERSSKTDKLLGSREGHG